MSSGRRAAAAVAHWSAAAAAVRRVLVGRLLHLTAPPRACTTSHHTSPHLTAPHRTSPHLIAPHCTAAVIMRVGGLLSTLPSHSTAWCHRHRHRRCHRHRLRLRHRHRHRLRHRHEDSLPRRIIAPPRSSLRVRKVREGARYYVKKNIKTREGSNHPIRNLNSVHFLSVTPRFWNTLRNSPCFGTLCKKSPCHAPRQRYPAVDSARASGAILSAGYLG